ncbi:MAG: protein translocase subunit SecD [Bdellovibrionales bacterium]|jgi:preprotein translocase subunit SecD|nr:protein translocase subunit SecD [Bdellovibrionales bacterium]
MEAFRLRSALAAFGILLAMAWVLPNVVNMDAVKWWPSKAKLNYGLDIQGGLHLVMGVDVDGVVSESTLRMVTSLKAELAKDGVAFTEVGSAKPAEGQIEVVLADPSQKVKFDALIAKSHGTVLQEFSTEGNRVVLRYYSAYLTDYKNKVITQAIETIRNRIDEFGVAEPSISQQGSDRILVQLPGMADAERAKQLINTTAKLDFMIVSEEMGSESLSKMISEVEKAGNYSITTLKYSDYVAKINQDLASKIPAKTAVYFEKATNAAKMEVGAIPYLLKMDTGLGGADLDGAAVKFGQFGEPEVELKFNPAGANKFADLTGANINKRMAIVLDKIVKSAPNIKDRIGGGQAVITMGGRNREDTMSEAQTIATALRAGALPASLEQLEERRVGPTLGADSIDKAKLGAYVGSFLIILFMISYYKAMGLVATVSTGVNIMSVFALLTSFGATLTLPGIAGIALTVGFAVDANVLIQERIREELRNGASWKHAIQEGYHRAMSAILDSNVTTAATAAVLLYFGTGPVRGFAVTLLIGIATTLFANVFVSKLIVDTLTHKMGVKKLSV